YRRSALDSESFRELIQAPLQRYCPLSHKRRGSQVVRSRSAKPLFAGSIPAPASFRRRRTKRGIRSEKTPVTQATCLRLAADTALTSALEQALYSRDAGSNRFLSRSVRR